MTVADASVSVLVVSTPAPADPSGADALRELAERLDDGPLRCLLDAARELDGHLRGEPVDLSSAREALRRGVVELRALCAVAFDGPVGPPPSDRC